MIERTIAKFAQDNSGWFPVVSVTGPRQSGKSTLVRALFDDFDYYNLEDEGAYNLIADSTLDFLRERPHKLVIDEAQRVPGLFSAIQVCSDEEGSPGQYVLSGSQNFLLLKQIKQSLAGRVGLVRLLPLSFREAASAQDNLTPDQFMLKGGYPRLYTVDIPPRVYYENYVSTYLERDVAEYIDARNVSTFRRFLSLCALSSGNLLNISRLAGDCGIARNTARAWLSILEASYIVFPLPPYFSNSRKRLTKTPKLYFYDTGLLCHLLGISSEEQLRDSGQRGMVFENLVIEEALKRHYNNGMQPDLFFYRDDSKFEIDLIDMTQRDAPELVEIKSGQSYQPSFTKNLKAIGKELGIPRERWGVVTRAQSTTTASEIRIWSAQDWLLRGA